MIRIILTTLLFCLFSFQALASPINSGISDNKINIDTKFTGTKLLLFGSQGESGDIIIAIYGPKNDYMVRKKESTFGIWHNKKAVRFNEVHSYHAIYTTLNDNEIKNSQLLKKLQIGQENFQFNNQNKLMPEGKEFKIQLIENLTQKELYSNEKKDITFLNESLFKASVTFPKNIKKGNYLVEIYLIEDDSLMSFQAIPVYVNQVGFSAQIYQLSQEKQILYGLLAVFLALIAGFIANYVFNKLLK